jgi:hypothetical protein
MRSFGKLRISARGSDAAHSPQLRLRGEDRIAILTAPLSMTVVIGPVASAAEAGIIFGVLMAPFGFAQGRL